MLNRYFTIVLLPNQTGDVKKRRVSLRMGLVYALLLLGLLTMWSWMIYDYVRIRSHLQDYKTEQSRLQDQSERIASFTDQFETVELHFDHLSSLHKKLRTLASLEVRKAQKLPSQAPKANLGQDAREKGIFSVIASNANDLDVDKIRQARQFENLLRFFREPGNPQSRVPLGWPVKGILSSEFGIQPDPFTGQLTKNHGVDIATRPFSALKAPADGLVISSKSDEYFGHLLEIDHGNGYRTKYGFISAPEVEEGDLVRRGQVLAEVVATGRSMGPHLHYEILFHSIPLNPVHFIQK